MGTCRVGLRERGRCQEYGVVAGGIVAELACPCDCFMLTGGKAQGHLQVKIGASEQAQRAVRPNHAKTECQRGPRKVCREPSAALIGSDDTMRLCCFMPGVWRACENSTQGR